MAAPTKTVPHPGRALAALIALIVIMLLALVGGNLFSPSQWHKDFRIGLGLDLSSGTQLSMQATTLSGGIPTADDMNEAKSIILSRVNASGNTGAEVQTQGNDILNVSVPGKTTDPDGAAGQRDRPAELPPDAALRALQWHQQHVVGLRHAKRLGQREPLGQREFHREGDAVPSASATSTAKTSAKISGRELERQLKGQQHGFAHGIRLVQPEPERPEPALERHYPRRREPGQQADARACSTR